MILLCLLLFPILLISINVTELKIKEVDLGKGHGSGFLWEFSFQIQSEEKNVKHSFYALYWPNPSFKTTANDTVKPNLEPLDPLSFDSCSDAGGTQKLKSKLVFVDLSSSNTGKISLFR
jgi:hypothetical protein